MRKTGNTLAAVLAGAAAGALAGVLLAPDQGKETRRKISDGIKSGADDLNSKMDQLKQTVSGFVSSKKEDFESGFNSLIEKAKAEKHDVIATLEQKLSELKGSNMPMAGSTADKMNASNNNRTNLKG